MSYRKRTAITQWCHHILKSYLPENGLYIDATMGNGHDTLFFCQLARDKGHVYAFDIQQTALTHTRKLLAENHIDETRFSLLLDSHIHMENYLNPGQQTPSCSTAAIFPAGTTAWPPGPKPL